MIFSIICTKISAKGQIKPKICFLHSTAYPTQSPRVCTLGTVDGMPDIKVMVSTYAPFRVSVEICHGWLTQKRFPRRYQFQNDWNNLNRRYRGA